MNLSTVQINEAVQRIREYEYITSEPWRKDFARQLKREHENHRANLILDIQSILLCSELAAEDFYAEHRSV